MQDELEKLDSSENYNTHEILYVQDVWRGYFINWLTYEEKNKYWDRRKQSRRRLEINVVSPVERRNVGDRRKTNLVGDPVLKNEISSLEVVAKREMEALKTEYKNKSEELKEKQNHQNSMRDTLQKSEINRLKFTLKSEASYNKLGIKGNKFLKENPFLYRKNITRQKEAIINQLKTSHKAQKSEDLSAQREERKLLKENFQESYNEILKTLLIKKNIIGEKFIDHEKLKNSFNNIGNQFFNCEKMMRDHIQLEISNRMVSVHDHPIQMIDFKKTTSLIDFAIENGFVRIDNVADLYVYDLDLSKVKGSVFFNRV